MQNWLTHFIEQYSYLGIFLMMALENVFPPIPSEVILTFGGFMTTRTTLTVPGVILAATLGSVLGAVLLYAIGRYLDVSKIEKVVERYGHLLRIKKTDIQKADAWFDKYGYWTILFCRMIPLVRSLISIPAGMTGMGLPLFLLFTTIGTLLWNIALVLVGALLGESWEQVLHVMDVYSKFVYIGIGVVGVGFLVVFVRKRRSGG
ncbi:DedA family protein [Brevibacillus sp. FSL K6-0770]|uniref:Alkaline phosphatase n=1 Tax=Brevibacillus parabrevis TaxID=54914 RepID=A0A4Y3PK33_BREPA|nr:MULTISPECIES: DedA family protein [Brevibacillus]MDR5002497.1 DedA family protein [Brevibacillus parabrevis]MED2257257.1 DedA family protein [Brevibacillus parabrevis]NRQ52498.1 DedA family protein [Brevibacillus sp. HD1.4A]RNB96054.1 DedA family protein [Brevibacillus parabrevis]GEB32346.1 alkaline phosphatase [Brevibacillus parabrevis]